MSFSECQYILLLCPALLNSLLSDLLENVHLPFDLFGSLLSLWAGINLQAEVLSRSSRGFEANQQKFWRDLAWVLKSFPFHQPCQHVLGMPSGRECNKLTVFQQQCTWMFRQGLLWWQREGHKGKRWSRWLTRGGGGQRQTGWLTLYAGHKWTV